MQTRGTSGFSRIRVNKNKTEAYQKMMNSLVCSGKGRILFESVLATYRLLWSFVSSCIEKGRKWTEYKVVEMNRRLREKGMTQKTYRHANILSLFLKNPIYADALRTPLN